MPDINDQDVLVCESCGKTSQEVKIYTLMMNSTDGSMSGLVRWCGACAKDHGFEQEVKP